MNGGLLDIRPPPVAPEGISLLTLVVGLLLILALYLLLRHYRLPRSRARRGLDLLRAAIAAGSVDNRAAAHTLAGLLRLGFDDTPKGIFLSGTGVSSADPGKWVAFAQDLAEARFASKPCSSEQLQALLEEAGFWLEGRG